MLTDQFIESNLMFTGQIMKNNLMFTYQYRGKQFDIYMPMSRRTIWCLQTRSWRTILCLQTRSRKTTWYLKTSSRRTILCLQIRTRKTILMLTDQFTKNFCFRIWTTTSKTWPTHRVRVLYACHQTVTLDRTARGQCRGDMLQPFFLSSSVKYCFYLFISVFFSPKSSIQLNIAGPCYKWL